jgi:transketolase
MSKQESQIAASATLSEIAKELRIEIVEALYVSGGGHYGGALSVLDILLTLYSREARDNLQSKHKDRVLLSKGHAAIALYAVLRHVGLCSQPLQHYGTLGSGLQGHPDMTANPAVEFSTGSLGQGLAVGLGMAFALSELQSHVWVVLGDGECQEGQIWETAMLAARYKASNLIAVIDANNYQEYGWDIAGTIEAAPVPELSRKWDAFGWRVFETSGHDYAALADTFTQAARECGKPTAVVAHTVKGYGCGYIEADPKRFHCTSVTKEEHLEILRTMR